MNSSIYSQREDETVLYISDSGWPVKEKHPRPNDEIDITGSGLPATEAAIRVSQENECCEFCSSSGYADYKLVDTETGQQLAYTCHACVVGCTIIDRKE